MAITQGNGSKSSDVKISWTVLVSAVGLIILMVGAFWTLAFSPIQDRFRAQDQSNTEQRAEYSRNSESRRQEIIDIQKELERRRDGVFVGQKEFGILQQQVTAHHLALLESIKKINETVLAARTGGVYVLVGEFAQFERNILKQLDAIDKAVARIEATRPTTGELQAISKSNEATISQLEIRIRSLEDYLRTIRAQPQGSKP